MNKLMLQNIVETQGMMRWHHWQVEQSKLPAREKQDYKTLYEHNHI